MLTKKEKGYRSESLVAEYFSDQGFLLVAKNYTIRGGEIDLIMRNDTTWMFVEVKEVEGTDDLSDYITSKKLQALQKTIQAFFLSYNQGDLDQQIVVVYTKHHTIYHICSYES
ncbi:MAG: YraN family protein [Candidatus Absconditabacterales bacterium]